MTLVPIRDVGALGLVKDLPAHRLAVNAWTDGRNIRFVNNKIIKMLGYNEVMATPSVAPYWAQHVVSATEHAWMYANLTKVYAFVGGAHQNITRSVGGDYSTDANHLWNGGMLGGIPVINNGVDVPQFWAPISGTQVLQNLTNWPTGYTAKVVRPFKNFLIALYVDDGTNAYPHMFKWSHPADPGAVPSSWDHTDPTKDAGERELVDAGAGRIVDGRAMRDMFLIFKENAVHGVVATGSRTIFRNFGILQGAGAPTVHCSTAAGKGELVVFFSGDDLIVFDGQSARSVLDKKMLRWLQKTFDSTNVNAAFVVANRRRDEVWLCFPTEASTYPDLALIWNYSENNLTVRDLPEWSFIAPGVVTDAAAGASTTWDTLTNNWDDAEGSWDPTNLFASQYGLLGCDQTNTKFFRLDETNLDGGSNMNVYLERTGLGVIGVDRFGEPAIDFGRRKLLTRIWIRATGDAFNVRLGGQEDINGAVTWSSTKTFTPGVDQYLDLVASGRYLAVRFESQADVAWEVEEYSLEVSPLGVH